MAGHVDILEQRDSLRKPFLGSLVFHVAVFGALGIQGFLTGGPRELFGDPHSLGGGAVGITPVSRIPLPSSGGVVNPVANDTESRIPTPPPKPKPEPERKKAPEPDPKAIALKSRSAPKKAAEPSSRQRYRPKKEEPPNQLYSSTGAAASSPLFGTTTAGSGGVGVGSGSPFGGRFGYYEQLLRQRVAEKWRTQDIDPRLQTAPPVIVIFEILRNGSIRNVRLLQRSGNSTLDYSAQRAVIEASPFPPLPQGFERDSAAIEFWFQLKR